VAAVGRGPENAALAKKLGAHHYIDSKAENAAEQLKKLGGATVILATAPSSKAMSEIFHGLGRNGAHRPTKPKRFSFFSHRSTFKARALL
jgi:D-arabinose 1-dehydrogenase-like Zn-dependent alcohol dehydrogenase